MFRSIYVSYICAGLLNVSKSVYVPCMCRSSTRGRYYQGGERNAGVHATDVDGHHSQLRATGQPQDHPRICGAASHVTGTTLNTLTMDQNNVFHSKRFVDFVCLYLNE